MATYYSPIVGNHFRLAGRSVLPVLGEGHPLILEPEPNNEFDRDAIKVCVDASNISPAIDGDGVIIHLGYIPRSGTKTDTTGTGTTQVLNIIRQPNWSASLTFSPMGRPLVRITTS
jgi:hypothetical protein